MYQKAKVLFLGLMFFTPLFANCAQLNQRGPDTPIRTEPTCWQGHSIRCWENAQGLMIVSHTYPQGNQPPWGHRNETRQLFCFHDPSNPFIRIDIPRNEPYIGIHFPYPTETKQIFTGSPVRTCQFFHNPQTNTYSIVLIRR